MPANSNHDEPVSHWIRAVEEGDEQAVMSLWEYCFPRLLKYSHGKLPQRFRQVLDEEDVALSAFKSFCVRAGDGSLGDIHGRDELWKLLYCISARKAQGYVRHLSRQKRGGGQAGQMPTSVEERQQLAGITDGQLTPDMKALFADQCQHLFDLLDDDMLETIALLRMEGYSVAEIATKIDCAKRSVERRLKMIRLIWSSAQEGHEEQE
jgi:DNA-directed RNA polymerase specialized sigma24 family protein